MEKVGLYAGSFDPFTKGHLGVVCSALADFDKVIVAVGVNPEKKRSALFSQEERLAAARGTLQDFLEAYDYRNINKRDFRPEEVEAVKKIRADADVVQVIAYQGLTIDEAVRNRAGSLIRGERIVGDHDSEMALFFANQQLMKVRRAHIGNTTYPVADPSLTYVSSSAAKSFCTAGEYIAAQTCVGKSAHQAMMEKYLKPAFLELGLRFGLPEEEAKIRYHELIRAYADGRHHHNLSHVAYCLNYAQIYHNNIEKVDELEALKVAIFYHDFVNAGAKGDEELSARKALQFMRFAPAKDQTAVQSMIMATQHRPENGDYLTLGQKLISDVDLAILGDSDNYGAYAQHVRMEYEAVSFPDYQKGRKAALNKLLRDKKLFKTPYFASAFLEAARHNLQNEYNLWNGKGGKVTSLLGGRSYDR